MMEDNALFGFDDPPPRRPFEAMVPLINIVFLLLIFFLLAGTIAPQSPVDVTLPEGAQNDGEASETATLYVEADGYVWFNDRVMMAELTPYLISDDLEELGLTDIAIRADADAPAEEVIILMEGLQETGIEQVTLITEKAS